MFARRWAIGILAMISCCPVPLLAQGRKPAPPPSRYRYTLKFDAESLPKGVKIREVKQKGHTQYFISNAGATPLIIHERYDNEVLAAGTKLVDGKTYSYFPNGVPMEGKTHLKGWQAPFGDIPETILMLPMEPSKIYEGRKPGLSKDLPKPEKFSIPAKFGEKSRPLEGTIEYHLNEAYDGLKKE